MRLQCNIYQGYEKVYRDLRLQKGSSKSRQQTDKHKQRVGSTLCLFEHSAAHPSTGLVSSCLVLRCKQRVPQSDHHCSSTLQACTTSKWDAMHTQTMHISQAPTIISTIYFPIQPITNVYLCSLLTTLTWMNKTLNNHVLITW